MDERTAPRLIRVHLAGTVADMSLRRREFLSGLAGTAIAGASRPSFAAGQPLRVGVIGAGILGASIALHLARAGARVTLMEKTGPAQGATQNSFAWLNAFVADPHYRTLRLQSLQAYRELDAPLRLGIRWGGYLDWAANAAQAHDVRAAASQLDGTEYPVRTLDADDIRALSPCLAPGPVSAAFFSRIDGHLDPVFVTRRFVDAAVLHGARVQYPCTVQRLQFRGSRLTGVLTSTGRVPLDRLVVASGVDTPSILAMAGFTLRLKHAPGILAHSVAVAAQTPLVCDAPGTVSFKQMADGRIVGTDALDPPDIPAHAGILAHPMNFPDDALRAMHGNRILGKIGGYLPGARGLALERLTLGFRPMPLDEFPVVGVLPGAADIHVAVTHSGVTLAPLLGRLTSREVLGGERVELLAPYRPERFA